MTEPLNIGGVKFSKTEVRSKSVEKKERTNSEGLWEQYNKYTVRLKDGTTISYEEQNPKNEASVDIQDDGSVNFYGLLGAQINDTEKDDTYRLMGCQFTHVMAKDEGILGFGKDKDNISEYKRKHADGGISSSKNNKVDYNEGDIINGKRMTRDGSKRFDQIK